MLSRKNAEIFKLITFLRSFQKAFKGTLKSFLNEVIITPRNIFFSINAKRMSVISHDIALKR